MVKESNLSTIIIVWSSRDLGMRIWSRSRDLNDRSKLFQWCRGNLRVQTMVFCACDSISSNLIICFHWHMARLVLRIPKFAPVSMLIRDNLHWLPAVQQIKFKILQLVANCLHQRAPLYLQELCVLVLAVPGRRHLRSADQFCLVVNRCRLSSMQRRGFAVAGPLAWNDLPVAVRVSIARNRNSYRTLIKTHLFNLAIKWRSGTVLEQFTRAPEKTLEGALTKQVLITYIQSVPLLAIFDSDMSFSDQINSVSKSCHFNIRDIRRIRHLLPLSTATALANSLVSSKLDYCNSLYSGISQTNLNKLQRIQNSLARVITNTSKYQHITPTLKKLHWLPIKQRIDYKTCLLTYKTLTNQQPTYFYNSLSFPSHSVSTRSSDSLVLSIPYVRSSLGKRAFSVIGPRLWNSLPPDTRNSSSLQIFCSRLKAHLFKIAFPP